MDGQGQAGFATKIAVVGIAAIAIILVFGSWMTGRSAEQATEEAVRSISLFYLDELAGRREQVVDTNLKGNVENMKVAVGLLTEEDLSDAEHLQSFQARMKQLYHLDKFAFVDEDGLIYTAQGMRDNIDDYDFDYRNLAGSEISVLGLGTDQKKVIIAMPLEDASLGGKKLAACFEEIDMQQMIKGLSLQSDAEEATFCNIYTEDGIALTDMVLGGLASEDNLLSALETADFDEGYSYEKVVQDFQEGNAGVASFTYGGIRETLDYVPIPDTDWMLTYLVRESVITDKISDISRGMTMRSLVQTLFTALVLVGIFVVVIALNRRSMRLVLEKETLEAESRVKQEEMEQRLALQEKLLEQEKQRAQQDQMITALASDYNRVYYIDLESDEGICYQANDILDGGLEVGEHFKFSERFARYADTFVEEKYRQGFLSFIDSESIRTGLADQPVITYRYLINRNGVESYEMLRMAGVRRAKDRDDGIVHAVGVGFTNVDEETRQSMAQRQALSEALSEAENASRAKTAFLSNMSHEIRTPMNAIIGLDGIALADPDLPDRTREHLEKIDESARHLLGLINDILDVSRIESGRMILRNEAFSVPRLLEQVNTIISSQCNDKGLSYNCRIIGQVDDCYIGDETKLRQVLVNVLGNAVKFTPEGGSVEFTVERTAQFGGKSTLRFVISDTGIGMDKDYIPHIFDAFSQEDSTTTTRYGSTGLGMAITKNIVEMMNGAIEVESEKGVGSTFFITVTLADAEDVDTYSPEAEIKPHEMSVLVIDDDPVACEHAKLVLESASISADTVESGAEAVEMVRVRHARRDPYDLILVDWKMPDMDGVETTRQIRAIGGDESAIVILTAYNWDDVLEEAIAAGVDSFVAKPLFASNVIDEFQKALKKRNAGREKRCVDLAGCRVLLAEDVAINAEILIELMKMREVSVEHAENGRIAVEMFSEHEPGYYDAVLMDMRMPEMDGLTATTTIRALDRPDAKTIPIIALTANAFDEDVQKSLQAGLNAHLSKPVDPEGLFSTLESFIGK